MLRVEVRVERRLAQVDPGRQVPQRDPGQPLLPGERPRPRRGSAPSWPRGGRPAGRSCGGVRHPRFPIGDRFPIIDRFYAIGPAMSRVFATYAPGHADGRDRPLRPRRLRRRAPARGVRAAAARAAGLLAGRCPTAPGTGRCCATPTSCTSPGDPKLFSAREGGVVLEDLAPEPLAMMQDMLLAMDPPRHVGYRRNVAPQFEPAVIGQLEDRDPRRSAARSCATPAEQRRRRLRPRRLRQAAVAGRRRAHGHPRGGLGRRSTRWPSATPAARTPRSASGYSDDAIERDDRDGDVRDRVRAASAARSRATTSRR